MKPDRDRSVWAVDALDALADMEDQDTVRATVEALDACQHWGLVWVDVRFLIAAYGHTEPVVEVLEELVRVKAIEVVGQGGRIRLRFPERRRARQGESDVPFPWVNTTDVVEVPS